MLGKTPLDLYLQAGTSERGGRSYVAYPSASNPRWVLPLQGSLYERGLELYNPNTLKGRLFKLWLTYGGPKGERVFLGEAPLRTLELRVAKVLGQPDVRLAFYVGTPGAYRKVTSQIMSVHGNVLAFAKMANTTLARDALTSEYSNLVNLERLGMASSVVPKVLDWFQHEDTLVLLSTAGPSRQGPTRLAREHIEFLATLSTATSKTMSFRESPMLRREEEAYRTLQSVLPLGWRRRYEKAFGVLKQLYSVTMPIGMAHRDFAPWNTRLTGHKLYVFDWEASCDGMTPLYDAFHFEAIQAALTGRDYNPTSPRMVEVARRLWSEGVRHLNLLYMAYLLDISLYYAEARARAPQIGDDRVWLWFGRQMDRLGVD